MKYLSLFSGIEACSVAWHDFGTPVAFSEIEPFPCAVLEHHYPEVPNLGDVTKITEQQIKSLGHIDLVVGGSPCQAFSVAGLRKGLEDPRGNLMLEFLRIVSLAKPEFVVWENVPGVLSDKTKAFELLLTSLGEMCYTVDTQLLDAQEFGVAQRRKRVFLVCRKLTECGPIKNSTTSRTTIEGSIIQQSRNTSEGRSEPLYAGETKYLMPENFYPGQSKTWSICERTTVELIGKLSLMLLGELSERSQNTQKGSVLQDVSLRILPKMMQLLGMPSNAAEELTTWKGFWSPLLNNLGVALERSAKECYASDLHYGIRPGLEILTETEEERTVRTVNESWSIVPSLNKLLEEVWKSLRLSITSTWTNEITLLKTYTFVKTVASIEICISNSKVLQDFLLERESLLLTLLQETIIYANKSNAKRALNRTHDSRLNNTDTRSDKSNFIADFGDWASRAPILLERESLRGDTPPSRKTGEGTTEIAGTLSASCGGLTRPAGQGNELDFCVSVAGDRPGRPDLTIYGVGEKPEVGHCLRSGASKADKHESTTYVLQGFDIGAKEGKFTDCATTLDCKCENDPRQQQQATGILCYSGGNVSGAIDVSTTITTKDRCNFEAETFVTYALAGNTIGRAPKNGGNHTGYDDSGAAYTLTKTDVHAVASISGDTARSLTARYDSSPCADRDMNVISENAQVRRLTPIECARLQGFPDTYLDIQFRNKPAADGNKYRALGNSMAVPVMRYIGRRIKAVLDEPFNLDDLI
jgi:DNA-cytosine methyltransferase